MVTFNEILNQLRELKALIAIPASEPDINKIVDAAKAIGLKSIPSDIINLHKTLDGFVYNGIEIYPFNQQNFNDSDYIPKSFISAAKNISERMGCNWVCFGAWDEEYFAYNVDTETYVIADRIDFMVFDEFGSAADLLEYVISIRS